MKTQITSNFSWHEMTASTTAAAHGLLNEPGRSERASIEALVKELLQPLRTAFGRPIHISSGYRSAELNRLVGGAPTSQHLRGEAADCVTADARELLDVLLRSTLRFDQAILYVERNFLHLSYIANGPNRQMVIIKECTR